MKNAKFLWLFIAAILFGTLPATAQSGGKLLPVYLAGDLEGAKAIVDNWLVTDEEADHFARLQAYYVLLNNTMASEDGATFNQYVGPAQKLAEDLAASEGTKAAESQAILAGIYGLKMAYSPMKGMILGPKSQKLYRKALKTAPTSPLVLTFYGIAQYNTPENWGGSVAIAEESLRQAIEIMGCEAMDQWLYPHARAWLGIVLEDQERPVEARDVYQGILTDYPAFAWVKNVLRPELENKR
ncbi:hypothetical protein QWY85_08545 [Neolewinella lacunae]|uniref:Tetratricopeptide repeat protein n=1 Tax=Neolewinella lacunae TaxID=1517758 RepID=A0A923T8J7_9BACT|nr:hypothetical protein [Neolewinella lacunae]MBC6994033.1 hypothetical protein [Neolewinella lacunae]MDN3634703.1 hypothetical protein [Neolewinella lacunae]